MKMFKKGFAVAAILACLVGTAWGQGRMKITVANYQMEPTAADAELLKFYGDKFGVDFEVINIGNDKYLEILSLKMAAGEIPDFIYLNQPNQFGTFVKQGVLAKIPADAIKKNAPDLSKAFDNYAAGMMSMATVNGSQYGIPAINSSNVFHTPLVYRTDWMKKVGVTKMPTTLKEFETLMYKFANEDPDGNGKKDTYGLSMDGLTAVFGAYGVIPFDHSSSGAPGNNYWVLENGKVANSSVTDAAKQALTLMAKWFKDGIIDPEFITGENQGGYWALSHAFIKGRIGFTGRANYYHWIMPGAYNEIAEDGSKFPAQPGAVAKEFVAANPNATLGFGQSFTGPTGKMGMKSWNRLSGYYAMGRQVEKDPAKMAKILQIWNYSANPDWIAANEMKFGPVNKYWKILDADTQTWIFIPPYDKDQSYWSRIGGELKIEVPYKPVDSRSMYAYSLGYDKGGIESLIQIGLPSEAKLKTDLMKLREDAYIAIITGNKPVAYFDEFKKAWLAAGGKTLTDEAIEYYNSTKK